VAPGQSCVFYDGDVVIGGGILRKLRVAEARLTTHNSQRPQ